MVDTLTQNVGFTNQSEGGNDNTWGIKTDDNWELADNLFGDVTSVVTTGGTTVLNDDDERVMAVVVSGTLVANAVIEFSGRRLKWIVANNTTGAFTVTVKVTGQTGIMVAQGTATLIWCDGTDIRQGVPTAELASDTSPQLSADLDTNGFDILFDDAKGIRDDSGNELLIFQKIAAAVNFLEVTNAATGDAPQIAPNGDDTNIDLALAAKGSGVLALNSLARAVAGILSRSTSADPFTGERYSANSTGAVLALSKSRNAAIGGHTIVQDGDDVGAVTFNASDGAGFERAADILARVDGTPGVDDMPGTILFRTTQDGAATPTERMAIRADGRIQIPNRSAPLIQLYGAGYLDINEISTPATPAGNVLRLFVIDENGQESLATVDDGGNVRVVGSGALIAIIEDRKSQGTEPQSLTGGVDNVRQLNTLVFNRNSLVALSSNRFTLGAGAYRIAWWAPTATTNAIGKHQTFLYNQSDSAEVARGTVGGIDIGDTDSDGDMPFSQGSTVVTITAAKAFEIRHRVQNTIGGGYTGNLGTEVYTRVEVWRA